MERFLPGTTIPHTDTNKAAFSYIEPLITAAGGFSLSQICAITGLESSTVQNWVKRGWVSNPQGKRYSEVQLSRIIILNALRDCLQLEHIAQLLAYINGLTEDASDDIIRESELYNYLCDAVNAVRASGAMSLERVGDAVRKVTGQYRGPCPDSRDKLERALTVMVYASVCGDLMRRTEDSLNRLFDEGG